MREGLVHYAWISLGSNLGDRFQQLFQAREQIELRCGEIPQVSGIYETTPVGFESENLFYNQCLQIETHYSPTALLHVLLEIERSMGRTRGGSEITDRPIDLDILFFDDLVIHTTELQVPHPRLAERRFVLQPLTEIAAEKTDPVTGMTVEALLDQCQDSSRVEEVIT